MVSKHSVVHEVIQATIEAAKAAVMAAREVENSVKIQEQHSKHKSQMI